MYCILALTTPARLTEPHVPWHISTYTHPSTHPNRLTAQRPRCTEVLTAVMLICQRGWRIGLLPAAWVEGAEKREKKGRIWRKGKLSFLSHLSSSFTTSGIYSCRMIKCTKSLLLVFVKYYSQIESSYFYRIHTEQDRAIIKHYSIINFHIVVILCYFVE